MNLLLRVDNWWIARMEAVLRWLNEWLSISWQQVAWALLIVAAVSNWIPDWHGHRWALLMLDLLWPAAIALTIRLPARSRVAGLRLPLFIGMRCGFVAGTAIGAAELHWLLPLWSGNWLLLLADVFGALLLIVLACGDTGERGRKRKAALAKLKEWFGTGWIVAPEPRPV